MTWTTVTSGLPPFEVKVLALDGEGSVYAGTDGGGIFKSWSGGE